MSGICGIASCKRNLCGEIGNVQEMTRALIKRGGKNLKVKNCDFAVIGGTSFEKSENEERSIPISVRVGDSEYTITFDGLVYNSGEVATELEKHGIDTDDFSDAEIVLHAYIKWGAGCLRRFNGIFAAAIWDSSKRELFLFRDRFGIKPLYYTLKNECIIFASELKGVLAYPSVDAVIDKTGVCEVMGLGPAQTQGCGIFKDIYEILPANCATFNKSGFNSSCYWRLESKPFTDSFEDCLEHARKLAFDAINTQLEPKGRNMCCFLSGGVDSSSICALAAKRYGSELNTFSLKYDGNDEYFHPTAYQPASDDSYINEMVEALHSNHHVITVNNERLFALLEDAVCARDLPGMADVDSSLYFLCSEIGKDFNGALSGECADEVFGGYPWFHRHEDFEANVFPWARNTELRQSLISPELMCPDDITHYIYSSYNKSVAKTPRCAGDSAEESRRREIAYLNLNWFMYTLGARSERIGMNCGLEIRMPFCDHKLVEYIWNVPWKFKAYDEREKGLLRMIFDGLLPEEVLWRKKSPFPKTHNPQYEETVKKAALEILANPNSRAAEIVNRSYIENVANQPSDYGKPWFGQLMATPQLYAYVIQLEYWLSKYNIKISI